MTKKIDKSALGYDSFHDVLTEVRDTLCLDLARYASAAVPTYLECLKPAPKGVYTTGRLEPILNFEDGRYYRYSTLKTAMKHWREMNADANTALLNLQPDVVDFESFIESREPIVTREGRVVSPPPAKLKKIFHDQCTHNYSAVYLLLIAAYEHLDRLHPETAPVAYVPQAKLKKSSFVLKEYMEESLDESRVVFDEAENPGIGKMLSEIEEFVGRDREMQYSLRLQNTTLLLEKGNDYRVIEYYRPIFDELDEWNHDLGC